MYKGKSESLPLCLYARMKNGRKVVGFIQPRPSWVEMCRYGIFGEARKKDLANFTKSVQVVLLRYPNLQAVTVE